MAELGSTKFFVVRPGQQPNVREILETVSRALEEKGYDPVRQIVGYIMSGDPTYITSHGGARSALGKVERDEIVEELLTSYIETFQKEEETKA